MALKKDYEDIPGTLVFDADRGREGYHLNQFCISLRLQENRDAFNADEGAYLDRYPMTAEQRQAVVDRDWNRLLELGGNIYYTSKLGANDGITFQQLAGLMTGMGNEAYRKMMVEGGRSPEGNRYQHEWDERGES
ncbi:MAG: protocatechuate 4,5-dioxygenase subunit alpha [Boseongicola sp.]|nr:protocatechuate 4,5-dioxygenase subunit alpha [Boseongicola sp.]MYH57860.1 protocatechuate 4,5-dioxygenase subunit alpha [Boseongicola sp. SB0675_bin_26]